MFNAYPEINISTIKKAYRMVEEHGEKNAINLCQDVIDGCNNMINNMIFFEYQKVKSLTEKRNEYSQIIYVIKQIKKDERKRKIQKINESVKNRR